MALLVVAFAPAGARAAERELDTDAPPSSAAEIESPIQRLFPREVEKPPLFPWFRKHLEKLPPFFADTRLEARFRTYWLRKDRTTDFLSEAWAMGGSVAYRSGWLAETFQAELEGFTSQPVIAPDDRDGTDLLAPGQKGYGVLGIANGKLRHRGVVLTGGRQYLDLPYFNRNDSRMTPVTYEGLVLGRPEGALRFSTGYIWNVKLRNSDEFESMTGSLGIEKDRGFAHFGLLWEPNEDFRIGAVTGFVPDLGGGLYTEAGWGVELIDGVPLRLDAQFTYQSDIGEALLEGYESTWNVGARSSTSWRGAVFRLGFSITGPDAPIVSPWATNPSYVDLMQRTFNRADQKALLASVSYDFAEIGLEGLTVIVNFVAAFDGKLLDVRSDSREVDVTFDYKIEKGWLQSFWLRLRGSWLDDDAESRDGTDFRVILRYDFPVI